MNSIFHDMLDKSLLVYLDDLLSYSETKEKQLEDVCDVLQQLWGNGLKAYNEKCDINVQRVEYLSHIISEGTVSMDPANTDAIQIWLKP